MIWIFVCIFIIILGGLALSFFLMKKQEQKVLAKSKGQEKIKEKPKKVSKKSNNHNEKTKKNVVKEEVKQEESKEENAQEAPLEDFVLEDGIGEEVNKDVPAFVRRKNPFMNMTVQNPARTRIEQAQKLNDMFDDLDDDDESDDEIEEAYQRFLQRRNQAGTTQGTTQASPRYTMSEFKNDYKSGKVSVADMLKKMSPEMKNLLLTNLLERKKFDADDF